MRIKQILVPLDGSENSLQSLRHALDLADQCGASITGLHVVTDMSVFAAVRPIIINEEKWPQYVKGFMSDVRKIIAKSKIPFKEIVIGGKATGYDIVTFADSKKNAIDLIVLARRGSILPKEAIPGSTTNFVIHKSKTPVLLVR